MANVEHSVIADAERHEPKGASTASDGEFLMSNGDTTTQFAFVPGAPAAILGDVKASGIAGGSSTAGIWITRDLQTEIRDPNNLMTIASNEFTPTVAGWVSVSSPFYRTDDVQIRIYCVTDAAVVGYGSAVRAVTTLVGLRLVALQKAL